MVAANKCLALQLLKKKGLMTACDHFVPSITFLWKNKYKGIKVCSLAEKGAIYKFNKSYNQKNLSNKRLEI